MGVFKNEKGYQWEVKIQYWQEIWEKKNRKKIKIRVNKKISEWGKTKN